MNSGPLSLSHGWAGRRIELRLTCNLQLQIVLPGRASTVLHACTSENLKLAFYTKICLIQNQYEDIVMYQILLIQCISSA